MKRITLLLPVLFLIGSLVSPAAAQDVGPEWWVDCPTHIRSWDEANKWYHETVYCPHPDAIFPVLIYRTHYWTPDWWYHEIEIYLCRDAMCARTFLPLATAQ